MASAASCWGVLKLHSFDIPKHTPHPLMEGTPRTVQLSGWLGAKATARDASAEGAADASRRRCPGKR